LLVGLEQLDEVAGGVGEQDLSSAGAGDRVAAEGQPGVAEPLDLGVQAVDDEVDAVASGCGRVGRGRAGAGAGGSGQQQPQWTADHVGEGGGGAGADREPEVVGVEVHGGLDVVDEIPDGGVLVGCGHGIASRGVLVTTGNR
jgi:hypothetical protein